MKRLSAIILAGCVTTFFGCSNTSEPGGPGARASSGRTPSSAPMGREQTYGSAETGAPGREPAARTREPASPKHETVNRKETFTIKAPTVRLKQGESRQVEITLDRGKEFKEDVSLRFADGDGITVTPEKDMVKSSDDQTVKVKVSASKNASVGEHKIKVTGKPTTGISTDVDLIVEVSKS